MNRVLKAINTFGPLIFICSCSDPIALSLPDGEPDIAGTVISREVGDQNLRILIDEAPGTDPCRGTERNTAAFFRVHPGTAVVVRTRTGKVQSFPADSLMPGMHVRAWKDDSASLDSCPPTMGAEVIEVVR